MAAEVPEQEQMVEAVVVHDGLLLETAGADGRWGPPAGPATAGERTEVTAERVVHEVTGCLVDGTAELEAADGAAGAVPSSDRVSVVCQLLSQGEDGPSGAARLRWVPVAEALADQGLSPLVRAYLTGHQPV